MSDRIPRSESLGRLAAAVRSMSQGSLRDARDQLEGIDTAECPVVGELVSDLSTLRERLAESLSSKETALATLQFSLLDLERARDELQASEVCFRELFSSMNDGVAVFQAVDGGADFIFKDVNGSLLRIERLQKEEVIGRPVTEVFPSLWNFGLLTALRRVFESGIPEHLEPQLYSDSRIEGWREHFVYRLPSNEIVALYRDVSKEKSAELALRSALASTERLIDAAPMGFVMVGEDETIRRVNDAAAKILGAEPSQLVGKRWKEYVLDHPERTGQRQATESSLLDEKRDPVTVLMSEIPVRFNGEEIVHLQAFLDLTERKLLETQLHHAQKLEAVGQLASGIAHEINSPAQFIGDNLSFLDEAFGKLRTLTLEIRETLEELMRETGKGEVLSRVKEAEEKAELEFISEQVPEALTEAREGLRRISTIVSALKEFARPDHREKSPDDLNRALKATLSIARNEYKYVAEIETDFGELPPVSCYIGDLNQVFLNLIVNAAHAIADTNGQNGRMGRIRIRTAPEGDEFVRIEISDTGCGIPVEIHERIFDPFFTTKEVGRGTGQGLAIARNIVVDKHRGTLTFESEVGKGTTFSIRLPVA